MGIFVSYGKQLDLNVGDTQQRKLTIMALKPGQNTVTVTFKNEQSGEYIFYKIHLDISEADVQGRYELACIVRDTVTKMITIENPLQTDVAFTEENIVFEDNDCNLLFNPIPFKIPADSERNFEIKYRPLVVGKTQTRLTLENPMLGTLIYELTLEGISSTTEKTMKFQVPLGSKQPRPFRFIHFCQKPTTY